MVSLVSLVPELLINIVEHVDILRDFTDIDNSPEQLALKNLPLSCHHFHTICFPYVFRSLRLWLLHGDAQTAIENLRRFINHNQLHKTITHIALYFDNGWNAGKIALELKRFLWEIQVRSLTLRRSLGWAPYDTICEKPAKRGYSLDTIEALRIQTVDDDDELMMLLRVCPVRILHVEDGSFGDMYDGHGYLHFHPHNRPPLTFLKPSGFPNLATIVHTATWPVRYRFNQFLEFVSKLPAIRHFSVTFMGDKNTELRLKERGYGPSIDAVRYREVVGTYQILARIVERMEQLLWLVIEDKKIPYTADMEPPPSFAYIGGGVYRRRGADDEGKGALEPQRTMGEGSTTQWESRKQYVDIPFEWIPIASLEIARPKELRKQMVYGLP